MRCNITFFITWHHWYHHWHHMMPVVLSKYHYISQVKTTELRCNMTFLNMWCIVTPMVLLMAHGTGTSTSLKGQNIPLNKHLITNAIVSLMAPSASCYCHVHDKNCYILQRPHTSHICQLVHVHIQHLCQCTCLLWTHCNQQWEQEIWYTYILHYWYMPLNKHTCPTVHVFYCSLHRPLTTVHISKTKQQFARLKYLPCYCHICANSKYATQMP